MGIGEPDGIAVGHNEKIQAAFDAFGWKCSDEFWQQYDENAWVFNLTNAVVSLADTMERANVYPFVGR